MERYDVKVAPLQETRWFGSDVYEVGKSLLLTEGRERPAVGDIVQRMEWVAIILSGQAICAWKKAGNQWKAWGSRAVSTGLQVGEGLSGKLHVVSYYTPIYESCEMRGESHFFSGYGVLPIITAIGRKVSDTW